MVPMSRYAYVGKYRLLQHSCRFDGILYCNSQNRFFSEDDVCPVHICVYIARWVPQSQKLHVRGKEKSGNSAPHSNCRSSCSATQTRSHSLKIPWLRRVYEVPCFLLFLLPIFIGHSWQRKHLSLDRISDSPDLAVPWCLAQSICRRAQLTL
jgi:hypothetical protein